jgi:hypothetical protein
MLAGTIFRSFQMFILKEMKIASLILMISLSFTLSGCMIGDMYYRLPRGRRDVTVIIIFILIFWMIRIIVQSLKGKKKKK